MNLPLVDECVERIHNEIMDPKTHSDTTWGIVGPASAGKSTALRRLYGRLSQENNIVPILVAPPIGTLDAAAIATIQVGGRMHEAGRINGKLSKLLNPRLPWEEKIRELEESLIETREDLILLCDKYRQWRLETDEGDHWSLFVDGLLSLLIDRIRCKRVVTQEEKDFRFIRHIHLRPSSEVEKWLQDADAWGSLKDAAASLLRGDLPLLANRSPLEIRLLVALTALSSSEQAFSVARNPGPAEIAETLAAHVERNDELASLKESWATLALVRRSLTEDLLLEYQPGDPLSLDILRNCLLYKEGEQFYLHDILKRNDWCRRWLGEYDCINRHHALADFFKTSSDDSSLTTSSLVDKMETLYHATLALETNEEYQQGLFFVEQLDSMARSFSLMGHYDFASEIYRKSIEFQPQNDYGHHYLAYNLEQQHSSPMDVERHYRQAIEINSRNRWWWPRYILFLIRRGRELDARRAWSEAMESICFSEREAGSEYYEKLHKPVAGLLLSRGLLEFAEEILSTIPDGILKREPFSTLVARLLALKEVRDYGSFLPAALVQPDWWLKDPPLPRQLKDGFKLEEWLACRVDGVKQDESFSVQAARVILDQHERPQTVTAIISWDDIDRWSMGFLSSVELGDFLTIGLYRKPDGNPQLRLHRHELALCPLP
ncbi:MAG: tetratricopeptide repeat protein [Candidatus Xenobiia bacterium LiM19]